MIYMGNNSLVCQKSGRISLGKLIATSSCSEMNYRHLCPLWDATICQSSSASRGSHIPHSQHLYVPNNAKMFMSQLFKIQRFFCTNISIFLRGLQIQMSMSGLWGPRILRKKRETLLNQWRRQGKGSSPTGQAFAGEFLKDLLVFLWGGDIESYLVLLRSYSELRNYF